MLHQPLIDRVSPAKARGRKRTELGRGWDGKGRSQSRGLAGLCTPRLAGAVGTLELAF